MEINKKKESRQLDKKLRIISSESSLNSDCCAILLL